MNQIIRWFTSTDITAGVVAVRLVLALLVGFLIGAERERKRQPAGLRTHILICLGSTLIMLLSIHLPQLYGGEGGGDPGRIAAQVVSGIGFLGAGTIMRLGVNIKGLTTAASIWAVAALGLCVGAGMFAASIVGTALILFALIALDMVEKRVFQTGHTRFLRMTFQRRYPPVEKVKAALKGFGVGWTFPDVSYSTKTRSCSLSIPVALPTKVDEGELYKTLADLEGVQKIKIEQG